MSMPTHEHPGLLGVDLAGLALRNPVILAAGTAGTLDELGDVLDLSRVGGLVTKSITPQPRDGNKPWRVAPLPAGMINAVGLANIGLDAFVRGVAPRIGGMPTRVIGSIAGFSIDDYTRVAAAFDAIDNLHAVELNVSCPNVHGGCEFGADPALLGELVREVRRVLPRTRLIVKLAPVAVARPGIVDLARAAIEPPGSSPAGPNARPGADALSLCNTMPAMAIDVRTRRPKIGNVTGGFSGPGVHPVAVRLVHEVFRGVAKATRTPLIGVGGVMTWEDAAEFILAGASAVQMGTALFADPRSPLRVLRGIERWVRDQHAASIGDLTGKVELP
ncbi:MAG: dihydroorotate dehydrogenase [Phycisphaerales bacterium]|nr:dihydroorotate dehydrogenase [Phycisphaerales bacterium]